MSKEIMPMPKKKELSEEEIKKLIEIMESVCEKMLKLAEKVKEINPDLAKGTIEAARELEENRKSLLEKINSN